MKTIEKITISGLKVIRVGTHKNSKPYLNFELNGQTVAMPDNRDLRKLRRLIAYVLKEDKKK